MTANTASNAMDLGRALSGACSQMRLINANAREGDADAEADAEVDGMDEATIGAVSENEKKFRKKSITVKYLIVEKR